ncbi:hypothetical protein [Nesterenkonia sp. HG001]|uniref:hypothetical protein n=1 Tax=Nesterenkonia sp. HG001 TaxID=2983207 RepID=UPI002AC467EB|nr:hypothetical protein [Nesterenkonia sp. HG001]MDZ5077855.1 hypothetical protein [Nesterenkonia sp. HG001]
MSIEQHNRAIIESSAREKILRALSEVAEKLDPQDDWRPLLDRAYELGYRPDWDGSVDFNTGVLVGGSPIHTIIDVEEALNEDDALALGHIDLATYELGKRISGEPTPGATTESDANLSQTSLASTSSTSAIYGWTRSTSGSDFEQGAWQVAYTDTYYRTRTIRRHGIRWGNAGGGRGGRAYWEYTGAGHNSRQWSKWRLETGSSTTSWAAWSVEVAAYRAQIGVGW